MTQQHLSLTRLHEQITKLEAELKKLAAHQEWMERIFWAQGISGSWVSTQQAAAPLCEAKKESFSTSGGLSALEKQGLIVSANMLPSTDSFPEKISQAIAPLGKFTFSSLGSYWLFPGQLKSRLAIVI